MLAMIAECQRVMGEVEAEHRSTQAAQAAVIARIQDVAFDLEGRCMQTSGEQRRVLKTQVCCCALAES
jgi:hypothetical protein